jgi:cytochrome P450
MTITAEPLRALPPGPRGRPIVGSAIEFLSDQLAFLTRMAQTYGDVSHFRLAAERVVLLNAPGLIRNVLVTQHRCFKKGRGLERAKRLLGEGLLTSEGDFHRRQRRLAQPAFHRERMAVYAAVMVEHAARAGESWRDGAVVDCLQEMSALTLGIVGRALFGADVTREAPEVGEALTAFLDLFWQATLPFSELLERLPLPSARRFRRARGRLDALVLRLIEERRRSAEDRGDLLSMLLLAQDTEGDGGRMSDVQVRDEVLTLFLAGHETTAVALTWTWYLLSQHPQVEARLRDETLRVLAGRLPAVEDVPRLTYTRMVVAEAMRLYPPAWLIARRTLEPVELGGYVVPTGWLVFMSQWITHRDPRHYTNPERFDPLRWTPAAEAARPRFAYFPFGGGPRQCIGEGFAWTEAILLLATLAARWRLHLVPGHSVVPQPTITLRPRGGMRMRLERVG